MKTTILATALAVCLPIGASASTIIADTLLDVFDSGTGPLALPYGGDLLGSGYPIALAGYGNALDGDPDTFVSLPTGAYMTLGFSGGFVFDGVGNDIFVSEPGTGTEAANVYVSGDLGASFTFLGVATGDTLSEFDLASIGWVGNVNAVRIEGLDLLGGSPGFDLAYVEGLEGSVVVNQVPLPAGLVLMLTGLGGLGALRRRR